MYPGHWVTVKPDEAAVVNAATGESLSWQALNDRSNQIAQGLRAAGLNTGDHVSLVMENHLRYFEIAWGALRAGLYLTAVNRYLTTEETRYILQDSGTKALFASANVCDVDALQDDGLTVIRADGEPFAEWRSRYPAEPLSHEPMGDSMLYSSGSTGRPKGIKRPLTGKTIQEGIPGVERVNAYGMDEHTVYLSPAPLYHAAPFGFCMRTLALGGKVIMMERFDPVDALRQIERHAVTHSQWVPTMFVRMLKLPESERSGVRPEHTHLRHPCSRTLPRRYQATDDGLVGADHLGVLRGH